MLHHPEYQFRHRLELQHRMGRWQLHCCINNEVAVETVHAPNYLCITLKISNLFIIQ